MPDAPADPVAATLAEVGERIAAIKAVRARWTPCGEVIGSGDAGEWVVANLASAADVPALLGAVEAATRLAGEWDEAAATGEASAAAAAERGADWTRTSEMAARAQARRDCAQSLRAAISAELPGGEGTDDSVD